MHIIIMEQNNLIFTITVYSVYICQNIYFLGKILYDISIQFGLIFTITHQISAFTLGIVFVC